ncbi:hypothetical protein BT96DRAFT_947252 [Gymnopus androsaceus JB14]|uniref:NB-ARC domain-containing protein n=1 Tax=Gymnopus androsaceus JB14 TaxID=1447944 RepID=A0A6A4GU88_9AGAR|nr:hypothetical protein BT96DRAFT_947252 [Gymnopus androsaceus JB14]
MFSQASNFQINGQSIFTTASTIDVTYHGTPRAANHEHVLSISSVLQCPSPSQYFVGRKDTLRRLSKIFSPPVVTIWSPNTDVLKDIVKAKLKYSGHALDQAYAEIIKDQVLSAESLLVLENADSSLVMEEHISASQVDAPMLVMSTSPAISSLASCTDFSFHLPECADHEAVGSLMSSVEKCLLPAQRIITLVANGGSGKTQVVLQFIAKNAFRFSNIWFLDATSNATLAADFKQLGKAAGVGEEVKDVYNFLARMHQNWLCIFDNADDKQVYLKDYIPCCDHGNIIITSRLSEASEMDSPGWHIDFGDLDKEDAIELLLKHAHIETYKMNMNLAIQIVDALGYHALAVSTAGAYIHTTATCTLANYLVRFNKKRRDILTYRMRSLDTYQRTVFSAFQLSFEKLSYPSQFLMQISAHFHPTAIPMEMFTRAAAFTGKDTGPVDLDPPTEAIKLLDK